MDFFYPEIHFCFLQQNSLLYPSPSSVGVFQRRVMGKVTTSVMENSLTLNAGDKIAHYMQKKKQHKKLISL